MLGMSPADQRLYPDDAPVSQANLWLILHKELRFPQRRPQIRLDLHALLGSRVQLVVELLQPCTATVFGRIECGIRFAQQLLGGFHAGHA